MGTTLTGALNAGVVGRNRDSEPISGFTTCSPRPARCCQYDTDGPRSRKLWHLSLVVSGGVCWWQTRSIARPLCDSRATCYEDVCVPERFILSLWCVRGYFAKCENAKEYFAKCERVFCATICETSPLYKATKCNGVTLSSQLVFVCVCCDVGYNVCKNTEPWMSVCLQYLHWQYNNNDNIISKTMFMVLSSWQSHCESSLGSFDECRTTPSGRRPKTKDQAKRLRLSVRLYRLPESESLHPPSPFIIITQPESWCSFYRPTESRRLSRPSWLVTYRDGLPV